MNRVWLFKTDDVLVNEILHFQMDSATFAKKKKVQKLCFQYSFTCAGIFNESLKLPNAFYNLIML